MSTKEIVHELLRIMACLHFRVLRAWYVVQRAAHIIRLMREPDPRMFLLRSIGSTHPCCLTHAEGEIVFYPDRHPIDIHRQTHFVLQLDRRRWCRENCFCCCRWANSRSRLYYYHTTATTTQVLAGAVLLVGLRKYSIADRITRRATRGGSGLSSGNKRTARHCAQSAFPTDRCDMIFVSRLV